MTREEALKILKCRSGWNLSIRDVTALNMAIKALEQDPCEDKIIEWKKDFKEYINALSMPRDDYKGIMEYIDELPVTSELCEDAISREQAINVVADLFEMSEYPHPYPQGKPIRLKDIKEKLKQLPPVQPKYNTDEWCHDCSEYNHDKHCCPRFNKVIRNTVEEIKQPRGHWKEIGYHIYECSECGRVESINDFENVYREYPYCHCGSRMIEPQESEEK